MGQSMSRKRDLQINQVGLLSQPRNGPARGIAKTLTQGLILFLSSPPPPQSIIHSQGQMYLFRHPGTENAADMKNGWGDVRWSAGYPSESEEPPNRGQAHPELQNLLETEEPSTSQASV